MAFPDLDPNHVFRDFTTFGVPASGKWDPRKVEIRRLLKGYESAIIALIGGQGGDIDLVRGVIYFSVTGGTANDIIAEPDAEPPENPGSTVYIIGGIAQENTGPVTINGKALLTNSGNEIMAGGLVEGGIYLFLDDGANYRLVSDQASAAIVAAAEQAVMDAQEQVALAADEADRSEAARDIAAGFASDIVSQGNVPIYSSVTTASAEVIPAGIAALRTNGFSATGDGGNALYKKAVSEPAHAGKFQSADGAWWEISEPILRVEMFGARPSPFDSRDAFNKAFSLLGIVATKLEAHGDYSFSGPVTATIRDGVEVDFSGAYFRPLFSGAQSLFSISGLQAATFRTTLTTDALIGDQRVSVASLDGIIEGQGIQLYSREWFDAPGTSKKTYETNRVRGVGDGYVYLDAPLITDFTASGDISGGGDGTITVRFATVSKNLKWTGGTYHCEHTVDRGISALHLSNPIFSDLTFDKVGYYGLYIQDCLGPVVQNSHSYDHGRDVALNGGYGSGSYGYGFIHAHVCFARVINCSGGRGWHTFDAADGVRDIVYSNCTVLSDTFGFSTHQSCHYARYENCTSEGKHSFTMRARHVEIIDGVINDSSNHSIGLTSTVHKFIMKGVRVRGKPGVTIYQAGSDQNKPFLAIVTDNVFEDSRGIGLSSQNENSTIIFANNHVRVTAGGGSVGIGAGMSVVAGNTFENFNTACLGHGSSANYLRKVFVEGNRWVGQHVGSGETTFANCGGADEMHIHYDNNKFDVRANRVIRMGNDNAIIKRFNGNVVGENGPTRLVQFYLGASAGLVEVLSNNLFLYPGWVDTQAGLAITHRHNNFVANEA